MNKYIGAHVEPYKPVDLTSSSGTPKKRKAKSPQKEKASAKKKAGTQVPYRLSDELVAVVGKPVLSRPQVTQALWAYIRANNLQVCLIYIFSIVSHPCSCLIRLFPFVQIM
jgi:upstream activation factor subunit UAF30